MVGESGSEEWMYVDITIWANGALEHSVFVFQCRADDQDTRVVRFEFELFDCSCIATSLMNHSLIQIKHEGNLAFRMLVWGNAITWAASFCTTLDCKQIVTILACKWMTLMELFFYVDSKLPMSGGQFLVTNKVYTIAINGDTNPLIIGL